MLRTFVIGVAVFGLTVHAASAQQLTYKGVPLRQAMSASLTIQAAPAQQPTATSFTQPRLATAAKPAAAPSTATKGNNSKSFWHTPWPYVIIGGATAAIIVIANHNGSSSTTNGGGY